MSRPLNDLLRRFADARLNGSTLAQAQDVSDELYEFLEKSESNPGFEGVWEVWDLVERPYYYPLDKDMDQLETVDALHEAFVEMFASPLRPHQFEVPFAGVSQGHRAMDLGGEGQLRLATRAGEHDFCVSTLSGVVHAATLGGSVRKVGRVMEEVGGALRAMGLAGFGFGLISPSTTLPVTRITDDRATNPEGQDLALDPEFMSVRNLFLSVPADLTELEQRSISQGEAVDAVLARYSRVVARVIASGSPRARELRNACRIAIKAETAAEYAFGIAMAFTCLESLLLGSKEGDVMSKLREAVAYSLGRTPDERQQLRDQVKRLYEIRSRFIHMGKAAQGFVARQETLHLMYRILRREMEALPAEVEESPARATEQ